MPKKLTPIPTSDEHGVVERVQRKRAGTSDIKVMSMVTYKCQLGNFESLEFTEGIETTTTPEQYASAVGYCETELVRRLGQTGKRLLEGLVLPTEGRSIAGQLAIRLQDGKVVEPKELA